VIPMVQGEFVTIEDVEQEISLVESLMEGLSSDDEFLQAILHNSRMMGMVLGQMVEGSDPNLGFDRMDMPDGYVGIAIEDITSGSTGGSIFSANGSNIFTTITAGEKINEGDVVVVTGDSNKATRLTEVDDSYLSIGKIEYSGVGSAGFDVIESESDVTIQPGETKTVLSADFNSQTFWWETGTNDETYSTYEYLVDGDNLLDQSNSQPLGLYNDMYRFPAPITIGGNVEIKVTRDGSAGGPQDYYSKITVTQ
jgi:hypothetical protein